LIGDYLVERFDVYCDEWGNTGANYLDPQRPIYVLGGWSAYPDFVRGAEAAVMQWLGSTSGKASELHGAQFLRQAPGQRSVLSLFRELSALNCVPFFVLAEKRYCVAGKIVDTFLNPRYNALVSHRRGSDPYAKQDAADIVHELPDEVLREFALAYRSLDSSGLRQSLQSICSSLLLRHRTTLADAMEGSFPKIDDIVDGELTSGDGVPGNAWRTLNIPVFVDFLCQIEKLRRRIGASQVMLVHDETKKFQVTFEWLFRTFKNVDRVDIYLPNGTMIPLGFEALKRFRTLESAKSPLIDAAHLLAGSLYALGTDVYFHRPIQDGLASIAKVLLPASTLVIPQVERLIASRQFTHNLLTPILEETNREI